MQRESPELPLGREKLQQETSFAGAALALPSASLLLVIFFGEGDVLEGWELWDALEPFAMI